MRPAKFLKPFFIFAAFVVLLSLGTWQLYRLHWKQDLLAQIDHRLAQSPRTYIENLPEFTPVRLGGRFLGPVVSVYRTGQYIGVAPFHLPNGGVVLVNIGYLENKDNLELPTGITLLEGVTRHGQKPGSFAPVNDPAAGNWYSIDINALDKHFDVETMADYVQLTKPVTPQITPQPQPVPVAPDLPNNHLQYALTWYGLALVLAGVILAYKRKKS